MENTTQLHVRATWVFGRCRRFILSNGKYYLSIKDISKDLPFSDRALFERAKKLGSWIHPDLLIPISENKAKADQNKTKRKSFAERNAEKKVEAKKKMVDTKTMKKQLQAINDARRKLDTRPPNHQEVDQKKKPFFRKWTDKEIGYQQAVAYAKGLVLSGRCLG